MTDEQTVRRIIELYDTALPHQRWFVKWDGKYRVIHEDKDRNPTQKVIGTHSISADAYEQMREERTEAVVLYIIGRLKDD